MRFTIETARVVAERYDKVLKGTSNLDDQTSQFRVSQVCVAPNDRERNAIFLKHILQKRPELALAIAGFDSMNVRVEVHSYDNGRIVMHHELDNYLTTTGREKNYRA